MSTLPKFSDSLSNDIYRMIFEKAGLGVAQIEVDSCTIMQVNSRFADIIGYRREELIGRPMQDVFPIETQSRNRNLSKRMRAGTVSEETVEQSLCHRDGTTVWVKLNLAPICDESKLPSAYVAIVEDITARRRVDQEIEELNLAVENAMQGISKLDASGRFIMVKPHYARMLGYEPDELVGQSWEVTVPKNDHPAATKCYVDMVHNGRAEAECQALRKDGTVFYKQLLLVKIINQHGEHDGHYCFMRDITKRKCAELSMVESRERLTEQLAEVELLYRTAPVGLFLLDTRLRMLRVNEVLAAIENKSVDQIAGQTLQEGIPDFAAKLVPICQQVINTGLAILNIDVERPTRDGSESVASYLVNLYPLKDADGVVVGVSTVVQDITEKKQAEQELRLRHEQLREMDAQLTHVSRLSTMGEMVAGIAHEINQPLSAIANFALASKNRLEALESIDDDEISNWLTEINRQAVRCGDIIRRTRNFVQKRDVDREPLNLQRVVRNSVALVGNGSCESSQAIDCRLPESDLEVIGSSAELQQVIVNLLKNASEATQEKPDPHISVSLESGPQVVRIVVEDNGPGIADEARSKLFEPFYTTKKHGMGMGLAISRSIIESHHGTLRLAPSVKEGARFEIELPKVAASSLRDSMNSSENFEPTESAD